MNLFGLSPEQYKGLILSVGSHREERSLSPVEVATTFCQMQEHGASLGDCAAAVHLDGTAMVSRFICLLDLHPNVRHLVDWGQTGATVAFTAASELARLPKQEHEPAFATVLENQLSSSEVKQLVQTRLRSGRDIRECVSDILNLRPRVERRFLFIGAVTSEAVRQYLQGMSQRQRDELMRDIVKDLVPDKPVAAKLGPDAFTVSSAENLAQLRREETGDFEDQVNDSIAKRIGLK